MQDRSYPSKIRVLSIVRSVRTRWRMRMALRGLSIVLGAGFLAFLLSAYGLEAARFSPEAVTALRILAWSVVLVLSILFLFRPLFKRVSDEQVALYLEEKEPSLEAAILGAVGLEKAQGTPSAPSPELLDRLVERAVDRARAIDYGRAIDRRGLYQGTGALVVLTFSVLLFILLGPANLRYGMTALVLPTTEAAEVSPYSISVEPGDATVARGADQLVTAELNGFDSDEVYIYSRGQDEEPFQRLSMLPADSGRFDLLLLNLAGNTEYFVEANGVRSPTFSIEVEDLPYVDEMFHTYYFPAYTGLEPREVEGGGAIAALAGTRIEMTIRSTLPTPGGRILVDDSVEVELAAQADGSLSGAITVEGDGVYVVELAMPDGRLVTASPEFTIDVLADLPPTVVISDPGRDASASSIEEVFIEAKADDDYGVRDLRLVYSVNGEPEESVSLFSGGGSAPSEISAGHTLFLEEWELEPGDVISYYAVARDNRSGQAEEAMSDIYFINVRPFRRDFRQADQQPPGAQQGQGQGAGAGQAQGGGLSDLQRDVVAATFNLIRDEDLYSADAFSENTVSVALAQNRVREEVTSLLVQMNTRGVSQSDPHFQEIAELLPQAIEDMETAEATLRQERPREALAPEQRALRVLQKAEETYERVVGQQQGGGGGGGGGGGASAEELADLFELELDKLQNQYETVQRGERQQADAQVDELMEKLKELARRQQQELERQRRRAESQQGASGGSGGESQRSLADETEEAARRLEELSRNTGDQQLAETARRLQQAAETMRRSAAGSGRSQGLADATSALDELEEAQRRLQREQEDRMEESIQDALERVDRLAQSQEAVREGVERLPDNPVQRSEAVRQLHERKDEMVRETQALDRDLFRMQQAAQGESREAAGELEQAVEAIREGKLEQKLAYSKGVVEQREREFALGLEDQIARDIQNLRKELEDASQAFQEGVPDRQMEDALERARDLARGAESLGRRLENRGSLQEGDQGQQGQQSGQAGQQGQQNQPGGQQGQQSGQPGQQGQQTGQENQQAGQRNQQGQQNQQAGQQNQQGQQGQQAGQQGQQGGQGGQRTGPEAGRGGGIAGDSALADPGRRSQGSPFGGATRGDPRPFTDDEIRQYTREFAQRLAQAQDLERTLEESGRDVGDLQRAMEAMEDLVDPRTYGDLPQIAALQEQVQESLKRLEFLLRREVEGEGSGRAALTGTDEVPAGFRKLVEEYFKNLARGGAGGG